MEAGGEPRRHAGCHLLCAHPAAPRGPRPGCRGCPVRYGPVCLPCPQWSPSDPQSYPPRAGRGGMDLNAGFYVFWRTPPPRGELSWGPRTVPSACAGWRGALTSCPQPLIPHSGGQQPAPGPSSTGVCERPLDPRPGPLQSEQPSSHLGQTQT